jgi:hypothetical protein
MPLSNTYPLTCEFINKQLFSNQGSVEDCQGVLLKILEQKIIKGEILKYIQQDELYKKLTSTVVVQCTNCQGRGSYDIIDFTDTNKVCERCNGCGRMEIKI